MADAPKLQGTEKIGESYYKINMGIDNANEALRKSFQATTSAENAINISNQAVTNANNANALSESVQKQLDILVVEGDSSVEAAQARVEKDGTAHTSLKEHTDAIHEKIDLKAESSKTGISEQTIWKSPEQPASLEIAPGPTANFVADYYALFDKLVTNNPGYVSKKSLGKEHSGTYDIFEYTFAPKGYEKTILLSSLCHGSEREGFRGLLRLMQHICNDYSKYPQLLYLRTKVRIICMPMVNPYGFSTSSRYNSRGVDINRNADYKWKAGATHGTGPASEIETQIYQNWVKTYPEATLLVDFHSTEVRADSKQYYVSVPAFEDTERNLFNKIFKTIEPAPSKPLIHNFPEATISNYAAARDINGMTIEWVPGSFHTAFSKEDVKDMMELFVNSVVHLTKINKPSFEKANESRLIKIHGSFIDKQVTVNSWQEMDFLRMELKPEFNGIVKVSASFVCANDNASAENWFSVTLEQFGNPYYETIDPNTQKIFTEVYTNGTTRQNTKLITSGSIFKTSNSEYVGSLFVKFHWKTTAGTLSPRRIRVLIELEPNDTARRIEEWSDMEPGTGASYGKLQKVFPK